MTIKLTLAAALLTLGLAGCGTKSQTDEPKICQSCAMPMIAESDFGTDANSMPSEDYCGYCYQDGVFTYDCTMEEMLGFCERQMHQIKPADMAPAAFVDHLRNILPTLKRWK